MEAVLTSKITCPECRKASTEAMPLNACIYFYECTGCHKLLQSLSGDCCVFCSFGDTKCPLVQMENGCCASQATQ